MKNQYFGNIDDYSKYYLLRRLHGAGLHILVGWMLTADDGSADGGDLSYLDSDHRLADDRHLFQWFRTWKWSGAPRDVGLIERSGLLPFTFAREPLGDDVADRDAWFLRLENAAEDVDLVFLDPDKGLETKSSPKGRKRSPKFVYWAEVQRLFASGVSVLVYQNTARITVPKMIRHRVAEARSLIGKGHLFYFKAGFIGFFLFCQPEHLEQVEGVIQTVTARASPEFGVSRRSLEREEEPHVYDWTHPNWNFSAREGGTVLRAPRSEILRFVPSKPKR